MFSSVMLSVDAPYLAASVAAMQLERVRFELRPTACNKRHARASKTKLGVDTAILNPETVDTVRRALCCLAHVQCYESVRDSTLPRPRK